MDTHTEPSLVSHDRPVKILKSQLSAQFTIKTDYAAGFWEMDTHDEPSLVYSDRMVEILKSRLAAQLTIYTDYAADFWEILPYHLERIPIALWKSRKSDRYSIYYRKWL